MRNVICTVTFNTFSRVAIHCEQDYEASRALLRTALADASFTEISEEISDLAWILKYVRSKVDEHITRFKLYV